MIFELNHENITNALKEYMDRRGILGGKEFTFQMKTSRKGSKTSRAIITTVDTIVAVEALEPVVEAVDSPQMELPLEVQPEVVETPAEEPKEEVVESTSTPFKKLFA